MYSSYWIQEDRKDIIKHLVVYTCYSSNFLWGNTPVCNQFPKYIQTYRWSRRISESYHQNLDKLTEFWQFYSYILLETNCKLQHADLLGTKIKFYSSVLKADIFSILLGSFYHELMELYFTIKPHTECSQINTIALFSGKQLH